MTLSNETWQTKNYAAVMERLAPLRNKPDGSLYFEPAGEHFIAVLKNGPRIRLVVVEQANPVSGLTQSRLNLADPLNLTAKYSQASLLALAWQNNPKNICALGFGGGRLPMVLHHYLPQATIEGVEIEPKIVEVATRFFGVQPDPRLTITVADGRTYLQQRPPNIPLDILFVDVFLSNTATPYHLITQEFFQLCKTQLSEFGVLCVNLLSSDPFYTHKVATVQTVFGQVYLCSVAGNRVLFAVPNALLNKDTLIERAKTLQRQHGFLFSLVEQARRVEQLPKTQINFADILVDGLPPEGY